MKLNAWRNAHQQVPARFASAGATTAGERFAAVSAVLLAAHYVADYWVQTEHQNHNKGRHGSPADAAAGRAACFTHVSTYTATTTAAVLGANHALRLGARWHAILAGQAVSAVAHYWADRRYTLRGLAARTGKLNFHDHGDGPAAGSAALNQSWHLAWLTLAALITATIGHKR